MRFTFVALVILFIMLSCSTTGGRAPQQATNDQLARDIDKLFGSWAEADSPGGAVVLTYGGNVILTRCYGLADVEHGIPITPTTRFELASVSKPFTGFAVLLLEKKGKLKLSNNIQEYLTELPDYGSPITIADLLYHTSGLSDWVDALPYAGRYGMPGFDIDALLTLVGRQRVLEFEPGTKWSYSNTNYALLAEIVSRGTEQPFGEWMQNNVFAPLGMHDTSFPVDGRRVLPNRANAYRQVSGGELVRVFTEEFEIPGPAHAFSTINDMAKWIDNLRTGHVGGLDVVEAMREKPTLKTGEQSFYGGGVGMGEYRGVRTVGHSGQTGAFKSELLYCPDVEVGIVVLANARWMNPSEIAYRLFGLYLGDKLEPRSEEFANEAEEPEEAPFLDADPAEFERYLGGYRLDDDPSVLIAVAREGNWLVGALVGEGLDFFRLIGPSEFENRNRNCRVVFYDKEGTDGEVGRARITLRGQEMWATRIDLDPDAGWIDECVGFYYSDEIEAVYEISRGPGGLMVRIPNSEGRPLHPADTDILAGGLGILSILRDKNDTVVGFDFSEPEDLGERQIRFERYDERR
jgi:CubicO group peptidase (beta-lactamase class C family)